MLSVLAQRRIRTTAFLPKTGPGKIMSGAEFQVDTKDGCSISARVYPSETPARGIVLIVPAMGVVQTYYSAFAGWLSKQGFRVYTFDYRGIGASRWCSLRDLKADVFDWARLDVAAMVDIAADHDPALPLYWIGHSLGGQIFALVPNHARAARMVTVACGSGYWRENAPGLKRTVWWMWYVAAPVALKLYGYFPGKRLRKIGDLPHGVMAQWRRWCLNPEYVVGAEGDTVRAAYAAVNTPVTSISFTDDEYMSARNVDSLHDFYVNARQRRMRFDPAQLGMQRIGHFGFFRPTAEASLWRPHLLPVLS